MALARNPPGCSVNSYFPGHSLVEDPPQQRGVVGHTEEVTLAIDHIVIRALPRDQDPDVGLVGLAAHRQHIDLNASLLSFLHSPFNGPGRDALRVAIREHQHPLLGRGAGGALVQPRHVPQGGVDVRGVVDELHVVNGFGNDRVVVLELSFHLLLVPAAVLDHGDTHGVIGRLSGLQEPLRQPLHKLLGGLEVLAADAGGAVHQQSDVCQPGEGDCKGKALLTLGFSCFFHGKLPEESPLSGCLLAWLALSQCCPVLVLLPFHALFAAFPGSYLG